MNRLRMNCHVNNSYKLLGESTVIYFYGETKGFPFNLAYNMLLRCGCVAAFPNGLYLSQTKEELQIITFYVNGSVSFPENLCTRKQSYWSQLQKHRWKGEHLAFCRASEEVTWYDGSHYNHKVLMHFRKKWHTNLWTTIANWNSLQGIRLNL